jgi:ESCRT-I complex subunit TSG101
VFSHIDGRTSNLLQADGTIPMYYQDVKYNIPITMWLLETYPRQPPLVFVTPTRDMIIKPRHPNVDASGTVNSPYLQNWVFPRSNLVELVQSLSLLFGQDPPLYSRPSGSVNVRPPPPPTSHPPPFINPIHTGGSMQMNPSSSPGPSPSQSPRLALTYPPYQHTPPPPPHSRIDDPREEYKRSLVDTLTKRLTSDINKMVVERNNEMETIFNTQVSGHVISGNFRSVLPI